MESTKTNKTKNKRHLFVPTFKVIQLCFFAQKDSFTLKVLKTQFVFGWAMIRKIADWMCNVNVCFLFLFVLVDANFLVWVYRKGQAFLKVLIPIFLPPHTLVLENMTLFSVQFRKGNNLSWKRCAKLADFIMEQLNVSLINVTVSVFSHRKHSFYFILQQTLWWLTFSRLAQKLRDLNYLSELFCWDTLTLHKVPIVVLTPLSSYRDTDF